jgi:imidazoleglycerol phosphate synthase glutamine amidotransferase subunit HisH
MLRVPDDLAGVDRVVLPGVASAGTTMDYLAGPRLTAGRAVPGREHSRAGARGFR